MAEAVYLLCGATSISCAVLLIRSYWRTRARLLLWSSLCFVGLALNNVLLFVDLVLVPDVDLSVWRSLSALTGLALLLFGLIRETN
jgi:hypothetical protein